AMIKVRYADKLVGHISRDATAIHAREKAAKKESEPMAPPAEVQAPVVPDPTRLQRQLDRTPNENLADLPRACDQGVKKDSQGKKLSWRGFKLHLDVADGDVPVSQLLTSAGLHDSQAAMRRKMMCHEVTKTLKCAGFDPNPTRIYLCDLVTLWQMFRGLVCRAQPNWSAARVTSLYDLADAAYDAAPIRHMSARLGHVAIIDHNPRRGEKKKFAPAQAMRYRPSQQCRAGQFPPARQPRRTACPGAGPGEGGGPPVLRIAGYRCRATAHDAVLKPRA
ncbi:MAG: hypothetical protein ABIF71_01265, partial [Planctomycetota bacterium]